MDQGELSTTWKPGFNDAGMQFAVHATTDLRPRRLALNRHAPHRHSHHPGRIRGRRTTERNTPVKIPGATTRGKRK